MSTTDLKPPQSFSFWKYYKIAAIYPFLTIAIAGLILALKHDSSAYKTEWSNDDGFGPTVLFTVVLSAATAILTISLILNRYEQVRRSFFLSFLSWFLLPMLIVAKLGFEMLKVFIVPDTVNSFAERNPVLDKYVLFTAFLHLAGLVVSFVQFRNTRAKGSR